MACAPLGLRQGAEGFGCSTSLEPLSQRCPLLWRSAQAFARRHAPTQATLFSRGSELLQAWHRGEEAGMLIALRQGWSFLCNWSSSSLSSCPLLPLLTSLSGLVFWLPGVTLTARVSTWGQGWFGQTRVLWPRFAPGAWVTWPSLRGPQNSLLLLGSGQA